MRTEWLLGLSACAGGLTPDVADTQAETDVAIDTDLPVDSEPVEPELQLGEGSFQLNVDPVVPLAVNCVQIPEQPFRQVGERQGTLPEWSFTLSFDGGAPMGEATYPVGNGVVGELIEYAEGITPTRTFTLTSGAVSTLRTTDGVGSEVTGTVQDVDSRETFELQAAMACAWTD